MAECVAFGISPGGGSMAGGRVRVSGGGSGRVWIGNGGVLRAGLQRRMLVLRG